MFIKECPWDEQLWKMRKQDWEYGNGQMQSTWQCGNKWPLCLLERWCHVKDSLLAPIMGRLDIHQWWQLDQAWQIRVHADGLCVAFILGTMTISLMCSLYLYWDEYGQRLSEVSGSKHFVHLVCASFRGEYSVKDINMLCHLPGYR